MHGQNQQGPAERVDRALPVVWWASRAARLKFCFPRLIERLVEQRLDCRLAGAGNYSANLLTALDEHEGRPSRYASAGRDRMTPICVPVDTQKLDGLVVYRVARTELAEHAGLACTGWSPSRLVVKQDRFAILGGSLQRTRLVRNRAPHWPRRPAPQLPATAKRERQRCQHNSLQSNSPFIPALIKVIPIDLAATPVRCAPPNLR